MRAFTWPEVWGRRLAQHALLAPKPKEELVEVVRAVCGMHAQIMPAAELAIGVRVAGVTRQDVRAALWQRRSLVKTYGLRGTVHLFPADEGALWVAALRASSLPNEARWLAQVGVEVAQKEAILMAIGEALDGRCLTREDLGVEVARRVGTWATEAVSPAFGGQWPRWQMHHRGSGQRRFALLRPEPGEQGDVCAPGSVAGGLGSYRRSGSAAGGLPALSLGIWPGHAP